MFMMTMVSGMPGLGRISMEAFSARPGFGAKGKKTALNRRLNVRIPMHELMKYSSRSGSEDLCNLTDLSETGMRFISGVEIKKKTLLKIQINLSGKARHITATGLVVWCSRMKNELWYAGVSFEEMKKEDQACLRDFIKERLCKNPF